VWFVAAQADRRLRHTHLTRVTLDLKDVALLPLLQQHLSPPEAAGSNGGCKGGGSGGCKGGHSGNSQSNGGCKDGSNGSNGDCGVGCTEQQHSCSKLLQSHQEQEHRQQQQLKQEQAQGLEQPSDQQQMPPPQQQQQQDGPIPWVVHGKHLCGSATDFALRGCLHALEQQQQQQACFSLQGLAIASCCHHR
jgi:hypothetical protein